MRRAFMATTGSEDEGKESQKKSAEREFSRVTRELAANILRVIRGAGKPDRLLLEMQTVIDAATTYLHLYRSWPTAEMIGEILLHEKKPQGSFYTESPEQ